MLIKNYKFFITYIFILLGIFYISRFSLVYTTDIKLEALFYLYSLRMDIIIISAVLLIPIILYTLNLILLTRLILTLFLLLIVYLEVANFLFFEEFNVRLNYLFIEYLEYPEAIFKMIWSSYKIQIILLLLSLIYISYIFFKLTATKIIKSNILYKLILLPFILIILFLGIRSSISDSTPNQSFYSYSNSPIKNDIANNTIFSLLYAVYLQSKDNMPNFGKQTIIKNTKDLLHFQKSTYKRKKKVVLILMESFGKSYVGSLGGTPTTPHFDSMTKDGLFVSNMYSSSNRSNRGFEAVLSSLFPTVSNTYLKLPKSQNNFWTVARTMKKAGYKTVFLYGGDSKFDNMKGFVLNNGFDQVVDKYNFDSSIKKYTWGVDDEELYKKANTILDKSSEPIFLVMFSLSSHKPFDYPDNRINYYDKAPIASFPNSIKYADFALNGFYKKLKINNFFDDGLLTIVADHNAHMFGNYKIPVKEFKIPALFIASDLDSKSINSITHQIDIAPTLLDIAGVSAYIPTMGTNLTKSTNSQALIVHRNSYAYLKNNKFILYEQNKQPVTYDFNYKKIKYDNNITQEGLFYIYNTYKIYSNKLHKDNF